MFILAVTKQLDMRKFYSPFFVLIVFQFAFDANAQINYELVWSDEFDGTEVDGNKWEFQIGNGCPDLCGWGNNESQYYRSENATLENGNLVINIKEETYLGHNYTSTRMRTKHLADWTHGKFEARIKLPKGQGIWPAFWLLSTDNVYGTWPWSGEIDIVERVGHQPNRIHGTIHYGGPSQGGSYLLPGADFSDDFHVFSIEWDADRIRWFVDGIQYYGTTRWAVEPYNWPFDEDFHIIMNCAVGGNWPGSPDASTQFPQRMEIDYVRVYQEGTSSIEDANLFDLKIGPNPAADVLNIGFVLAKNEAVKIELIDMTGRVMHSQPSTFQPGEHRAEINVADLAAGMYVLNVQIGETLMQRKVMVD